MINKIISKMFLLLGVLLFSLTFLGCDTQQYNNVLENFDITDEKIIWNGDINDSNIRVDSVIVTLKKTETYPELELSVFGLDNAISMKYLDSITMPENISNPDKWRQKVIIYLIPEGKEKLIETIRKLEQLKFVKSVDPNWINEGA